MSFETVILQIATPLSITPIDVYILFVLLVFIGIFTFFGIERIYSTFFGIVLGIGIFVLLSTLLSPQYQTPETQKLIGESLSKVIVGSSVYLIFILSVLVPINGNLALTYPKTPPARIIQTLLLSIGLFLFYGSTIAGLIERGYIFTNTNSAFILLKNTSWFSDFQSSKFAIFLFSHFPIILLLGISFMIYKMLFSDIVNAVIASIITSIKKRKNARGDHGHGGSEHEEEHDTHDMHDEFEMHEEHHGHH